MNKLKAPQVETMVDALCSNMTSHKEQLRDISSMGLKTVITELSSPGGNRLITRLTTFHPGFTRLLSWCGSPGVAMTASVCKKITSQLIAALETPEDVLVQLEALDILSDMLAR